MSVEENLSVLRRLLVGGADPEDPVILGPASTEDLDELSDRLQIQMPDELKELWSFAASGFWTLLDELFSPQDAAETTLHWREILAEYGEVEVDGLPLQDFVAFSNPSGIAALYLVNGPGAGSIVLIDPQDASHPTLLASSLRDYVDDQIALVQERGVHVVTVQGGTRQPIPLLGTTI